MVALFVHMVFAVWQVFFLLPSKQLFFIVAFLSWLRSVFFWSPIVSPSYIFCFRVTSRLVDYLWRCRGITIIFFSVSKTPLLTHSSVSACLSFRPSFFFSYFVFIRLTVFPAAVVSYLASTFSSPVLHMWSVYLWWGYLVMAVNYF